MLTEFGKLLRKIRIDRGEIIKNMADKLDVTSSYLSAVETGKRNIPQKWIEVLPDLYGIDKQELKSAAELSIKNLKLNLQDKKASDRELAIAFARNFDQIGEEKKKSIFEILSSN